MIFKQSIRYFVSINFHIFSDILVTANDLVTLLLYFLSKNLLTFIPSFIVSDLRTLRGKLKYRYVSQEKLQYFLLLSER